LRVDIRRVVFDRLGAYRSGGLPAVTDRHCRSHNMSNETLKRQIVVEAAAQVVSRREQNYHRAIRKAAKYLGVGRGFRGDLPTPRELHAELQRIHSRHEEGRPASLVLVDPLLVENSGDLPTPTIDRFS